MAKLKEQLSRINLGSIEHAIDYPDFLGVQVDSFKNFFQLDTPSDSREEEGLFKVFSKIFPINDARNVFNLEFLDYFVDPPRYDMDECIERGLTYSVPLKAKLRLSCNDEEHIDFETIEQDVFLGNIPYMTPRGSFIINGAERVIVSQLHRSPGVIFGSTTHPNGTKLYSARIIPFKGTWMEFSTDIHNVLHAYLDRKKKVPITTLLRAIGYGEDSDILNVFGMSTELKVTKANLKKAIGQKLAARVLRSWVEDFVDEDTGEVVSIDRYEIILERGTELDKENIEEIIKAEVKTIILQKEDIQGDFGLIYNTLQKDPSNSELEAIQYIYRQLRSADPPDEETARGVIEKLFFSDKRYDLGEVGRYKINKKLNLDTDPLTRVLTNLDITEIVKYLINLFNSKAELDDIDHLSNRRIRTVGEQLYDQFDVGLNRMVRTIREKMNVRDNEVFTPIDLINARTLASVINSFFGTSQLSQFLDQTNPLAETTHKRRISALGPGGLTRENAGFEVRDVHYSHYGRLCTIETPEGPNIGLISTLAVHGRINRLGFIETPYREVDKGIVKEKANVIYLSADLEDERNIAQANAKVNSKGEFEAEKIKCRETGDFPILEAKEVDFMDVAPNQILGVAASLIPFIEHNDANRALMGSNMQRQAVPLLQADAPIVGTGLEHRVASDSRMLINAEGKGVVDYVDANEIVIKYDLSDEERIVNFDTDKVTYKLTKFRRTNQNTCINLKPIVKKGDKVVKGQVLCEGFATSKGELALGRNLTVAFMPWKGYNFEDAIVISERVVKEDLFTSVHIEGYELEVRDTKLGEEELTADIPNVSEEATKDLDENGIIRVGAFVKDGDILIGKITPKGESDPTPEEKLLRAIFGDKAGDVKDASLKTPPSVRGIVIDKKLFARNKKTKASKSKEKAILTKSLDNHNKLLGEIKAVLIDKLVVLLKDKTSVGVYNEFNEEIFPRGTKFSRKSLQDADLINLLNEDWVKDDKTNKFIKKVLHNYKIKINEEIARHKREKFSITVGDELPSGVLKLAKVYIAKKRKLKVGDKLAGRHGNKGVVAKIVREEDMPFLENGSPVDIVLNPLGVPSRMNLGQIYETVLGWAGKELGKTFATPTFDGAPLETVKKYVEEAGLPRLGSTYLYDGETGRKFDQPTTVGVIYMLKLAHMVDDKMHSRSIGPYSLITQQPLGGKAQFGGQRLGEMEVWALEAYGAANVLQEMLTVKSDDIQGRAKTYEAIVKGDNLPNPGVPESFNVLINELKGLSLDLKFE